MKKSLLFVLIIFLTSCRTTYIEKNAFLLDSKDDKTSENLEELQEKDSVSYYLIFERDREDTINRLKFEKHLPNDEIEEDSQYEEESEEKEEDSRRDSEDRPEETIENRSNTKREQEQKDSTTEEKDKNTENINTNSNKDNDLNTEEDSDDDWEIPKVD